MYYVYAMIYIAADYVEELHNEEKMLDDRIAYLKQVLGENV